MISIQALDTQLLLFVNHNLANPVFDVLMPALTLRGYLLVIPFLLAMFLSGAKQKNDRDKTYLSAAVWTVLMACCAAYLAILAEFWMKDAIARTRPCREIEGIRLILSCPKSYSMPSGHAFDSFAFATPIFYLTRRYIALAWRLYPLVLAFMVAFSRIYLGVHYPTDVLVGAILGAAIGTVLSLSYELIATEEFVKWKKR